MNQTGIYPEWFHRGGTKMSLNMSSHNIYVKFKNQSGSVELTISKNYEPRQMRKQQLKWIVWWEIKSDYGLGIREGRDLWTDYDIKSAFDLILVPSAKKTVSRAGKFYREDSYLNIPGMGTGQNGDANVSIFVTDEIKTAIEEILMGGKCKRAA